MQKLRVTLGPATWDTKFELLQEDGTVVPIELITQSLIRTDARAALTEVELTIPGNLVEVVWPGSG